MKDICLPLFSKMNEVSVLNGVALPRHQLLYNTVYYWLHPPKLPVFIAITSLYLLFKTLFLSSLWSKHYFKSLYKYYKTYPFSEALYPSSERKTALTHLHTHRFLDSMATKYQQLKVTKLEPMGSDSYWSSNILKTGLEASTRKRDITNVYPENIVFIKSKT